MTSLIGGLPETAVDVGQPSLTMSQNWRPWFVAAQLLLSDMGNSGTTAERPTTKLYVGKPYFDTTLGEPVWYDGSTWVEFPPPITNLTDLTTRNHNDLQNIQGGTTAQYYHLKNDWTNVQSYSVNTTLDQTNGYALMNCTAGIRNFQLPAASLGYRYHCKKTDASANAMRIDRAGADLFEDGTSQLSRGTQNGSYTIYGLGTVWYIEAVT